MVRRVSHKQRRVQKAFKQKVTGIAAGSVVEVKLHNKEIYRGRLGDHEELMGFGLKQSESQSNGRAIIS